MLKYSSVVHPFFENFTAKLLWYHRGCGYLSSSLEFLELRVRQQASFHVPAQVQPQKLDDRQKNTLVK